MLNLPHEFPNDFRLLKSGNFTKFIWFIAKTETELDSYHQKGNGWAASRVTERLKLLGKYADYPADHPKYISWQFVLKNRIMSTVKNYKDINFVN